MSNKEEFIGQKIIENQDAQREHNKKMHDDWLREGETLRNARLALQIGLKEISKQMGCCDKTIRRFERGLPVKRRPLVLNGYKTALKYITLARKENAGDF